MVGKHDPAKAGTTDSKVTFFLHVWVGQFETCDHWSQDEDHWSQDETPVQTADLEIGIWI